MKYYFLMSMIAAASVANGQVCDEDAATKCLQDGDNDAFESSCADIQFQLDATVECLTDAGCLQAVDTFCYGSALRDGLVCPSLTCNRLDKKTLDCAEKLSPAIDEGINAALIEMMENGGDECDYWHARYKTTLQELSNEYCISSDHIVDAACDGAVDKANEFNCSFTCSRDSFDLTPPIPLENDQDDSEAAAANQMAIFVGVGVTMVLFSAVVGALVFRYLKKRDEKEKAAITAMAQAKV